MAKKMFTIIISMLFINHIESNFHNPDCTHDGLGCLSCTHRKLCVRWWFWAPLARWGEPSACSDPLTGHSLPYCNPDTNQCVSYVPQQCSIDGTVTCLRKKEGNFYPDIRNCKKYFGCQEGVPRVEACGTGRVYKQQWRKCVVNLSSRRDCFEVTKCPGSNQTYPGDSSMYYKCSEGGSVVKLAACLVYNEEYDPITESCRKNRCSTEDGTLLAIPYKCSAYFDCRSQTEMNCPQRQGFNARTKKCAPFYNRLCNELGLLENNVKSLLGGNFIFNFLEKLFDRINFSPYAFISILPIPDSVISTAILVTDYLYNERSFPPGLINYLIESALAIIPPQIRTILDMLLKLLPFKLPSANHLTTDEQIALAMEQEFTNINFTEVGETLREIHSVPETFRIFIKHLANRLNVPPENVYGILQLVAPTLADTINRLFGTKILVVRDKDLTLDRDGLWQNLQEQLERVVDAVGAVNGDVAGFIKDILKTYVDEAYQFVQSIVKEVYLPLRA